MLPWWAWLLLGLGGASAVGAVAAYVVLRATAAGRRFLALSRRGKVRFGRSLVRDPAVPRRAKWILGGLAIYLAFPLDIIPDAVPILGHLDDLLVALLAIALVLVSTPREALERALREGEAYDAGRRRAAP
ncbi:hypothetical protein HRbin29_02335 [bacterium HR29]|jgi:uncharacterized membrane protein YkvA (DUF1232 family)|nr:hypothetical protein HRbin29_02335 [bacterium HR29]